MKVTLIEEINGDTHIPRTRAANKLGVSLGTIDNYIRGIEKEVKRGRYGRYSVIKPGGLTLISYPVLLDYLKYRQELKDANARKYVPEFDIVAMNNELGFYKN